MMQSAFQYEAVKLEDIHLSVSSPAPPILARPVEVKRHFYRCADCLSVVAVDGARLVTRNKWGNLVDESALCGACGGAVEYMGQVERDRLVQYDQLCACDERCQSAKGPICNCRCGGVNHGHHVTVEVRRDEWAVPILVLRDTIRARYQADEYRALAEQVKFAIEARYGRLFEMKARGEWIDNWTAYMNGSDLLRSMYQARELRSHAGRNKKLRWILAEAARPC